MSAFTLLNLRDLCEIVSFVPCLANKCDVGQLIFQARTEPEQAGRFRGFGPLNWYLEGAASPAGMPSLEEAR